MEKLGQTLVCVSLVVQVSGLNVSVSFIVKMFVVCSLSFVSLRLDVCVFGKFVPGFGMF